MNDCLFCRLSNHEIPARIVYEDDSVIAFHDINPKADIHVLIIPRVHIASMLHLEDNHQEIIGGLMLIVPVVARILGLESGFKTIIHTGKDGGQEIDHLHLHILGMRAKLS
jgi:histidine triad (HIT) family protein